jgi:hypothetical protein
VLRSTGRFYDSIMFNDHELYILPRWERNLPNHADEAMKYYLKLHD